MRVTRKKQSGSIHKVGSFSGTVNGCKFESSDGCQRSRSSFLLALIAFVVKSPHREEVGISPRRWQSSNLEEFGQDYVQRQSQSNDTVELTFVYYDLFILLNMSCASNLSIPFIDMELTIIKLCNLHVKTNKDMFL